MALNSASGTATVSIAGTTETVIGSTSAFTFVPVGSPTTYAGMVVRGMVNLTPGGGVGETYSARVRQGTTTTGTLLGGMTLTDFGGTAVAQPLLFSFETVDSSTNPASQYSVSAYSSAATLGTVTAWEIEIDPIIP